MDRVILLLLSFSSQLFFFVHCDHAKDGVPFVSQNLDPRLNSHVDQLIRNHWNQELIYLYYGTYFTRADVSLHGFGKFFHKRSLDVGEQRVNITTLINKRGGYVSFGRLFLNAMCDTIEKSFDDHDVSLDQGEEPFSCSAYICHFLKKDESSDNDVGNYKKNDYLKKKSFKYGQDLLKKKNKKNKQECDMEFIDFDDWRPALFALRDLVAMEKFIVQRTLKIIDLCSSENYGDPFMRHNLEDYLQEPTKVIKEVSGLLTRLQGFEQDEDYFVGEFVLDKELQS